MTKSNETTSMSSPCKRSDNFSAGEDMTNRGSLTSWITVFMAFVAGAAMANNYIMHPILPDVATSLDMKVSATGLLAGATQAGYLIGIFLLVPLGDLFNLKKVIIAQQIVLTLFLLFSALSTNYTMMLIGLFIVGLVSSSSLQISSLGFRVSPKKSRGATMGTIMAGISAGIVLSRIISGYLSDEYGWRSMLLILSGMTAFITVIAIKLLPNNNIPVSQGKTYTSLLKRLPKILSANSMLKTSITVGSCWFFIFSMLWVSLSIYLYNHFSLTSTEIGLFGFAGLAGVLATRPAGKLVDRVGTKRVMAYSFVTIFIGIILLLFGVNTLWPLVFGVILFDVGVFSAQVANQMRVLSVDSASRNSVLSIYMCFYYGAGSLGSSLGSYILGAHGWFVLCGIAASVCAFGLLVVLKGMTNISDFSTYPSSSARETNN
ncbi:MFS transporter [Marinobacter salarius]|uniref:MFS transporter n=1 Tax=Marinobacter salarius TaxID=1420917 RepID=UPI0030084648